MTPELPVSVVMPYYRNAETLVRCIQSFALQYREGVDEIIVADDGDSPEAHALLAANVPQIRVTCLHTRRSGQSAATNRAIERATCDLVVLTCADIIAAPRLLSHHRQAHIEAEDIIAVQGYLPYAPWLKQSPFMRYLQSPGPQFSFQTIENIEEIDPGHIYAPNLSARRNSLLQAGLFDELFPYGFQDTDLGFRLKKVGVRLTYCKEAIGYHDHETNLRAFLKRQQKVGESLPRMMRQNWSDSQRQTVAARLQTLVSNLHQGPLWLDAAEKIEAQIGCDAKAFSHAEEELCGLYTRLSSLAVVQGALRYKDELIEAAPSFALFLADRSVSNFSF